MDEIQLQTTILKALYEIWANIRQEDGVKYFPEVVACPEPALIKAVRRLEHENLIRAWASDWRYELTSNGISYIENIGLVDAPIITKQQAIRFKLLDSLAKTFDEEGSEECTDFRTMVALCGSEEDDIISNLRYLSEMEYVKDYRITLDGYDWVKEQRQKVSYKKEFEQISLLTPQTRGRMLQKLIAKVIEQNGWSQEEGVKTSHEEMDVIVFQKREYYLIESKWEKDLIEASVIRELLGKLGNRIGVNGIVASLSGFTSGAVEQAEKCSGQKIILLFGQEDISSLINQTSDFDTLLNKKYKELVTKTKTIYS